MVMLWLQLCDDSCVNRGEAHAGSLANEWRVRGLIEGHNIVVTIRCYLRARKLKGSGLRSER